MFRVLSLFVAAPAVYALYSVHYIAGSDQPQLVGKQKYLTQSPEPVQVADIYSRMSGMSPLLHEGKFVFYIERLAVIGMYRYHEFGDRGFCGSNHELAAVSRSPRRR